MRCFSEGHGNVFFFFLSFVIFFSLSKTHQTMMDEKGSRRWNVSTFTAAIAQLEKPTRFFFLTRLQLAPSLCFGAREQSCCSCSSMSKSWGEGAKVREMPKDNKQKVSLQKGLGGVFWVFFVRCLKPSSGKQRWEESCWRTVSIYKDLLRTGDAPPAR